jgi:hypothetical protein
MARTPFKFAMLFAGFLSAGFAAGPLAMVSSSQPFHLDGHPVTAVGVTSWPVVAGDDLATAKFPAVLYFHDGSSVQLAADSSVTLGGSAEEPKLVLTSGKLGYKLVAGSKIAITNAAVRPAPTKGKLMGSLMNWAHSVPASSARITESNAVSSDALAARLPPVSAFQ